MTAVWWRLVRFGFWLLYNPFAFTYDWVSSIVSFGAWRSWGAAALKFADSRGVILDLAHGTGNLQLDMASRGWRTVGYDLSPNMGRITQRKLKRKGFAAPLVRGRAQSLPFPNGAFSAVVSTFPTDFITSADTLDEIHRVLVDEGTLVIVPSAVFTGGGVGRRVLEFAYRVTGQHMGEQDDSIPQVVLEQWQPVFERHEFSLSVHIEPCSRSEAIVLLARKKA